MLCLGNILFDPILWFCASGNSFFAGTILLILTASIHSKTHHKVFLYSIYLLYIFSLLAIILSSTPLHPVLYLLWIIIFIGWLIIRTKQNKYTFATLCVLIGISLIAVLIETPWHYANKIPINDIQQIYVVGDSISAGMGNKNERTWSVLLSEKLGVPVTNLSIAGATADSALERQVPKIVGQNNLVFLEIGGNDLLNYNSPEEYEKDLTEIIQRLKASSNKIVWFELPLLPQYYPYGRIQRKLAKQLNVDLLPKSVLSTIFSTQGATSDGIHLTLKGHKIMAQEMQKLIQTERRLP